MTEAYLALADCARRRIEHEWRCTEAERQVLALVCELSYDLGQSLALVPCLNDFAAVAGVHKSTISRALRSALKKGYLEITKRREETLYRVCTETPADAPQAGQTNRDTVFARLLELNQTRLQGVADGNGQQRIPGILENEEQDVPVRALDAMLEETTAEPQQAPAATSPPAVDPLERLIQTVERKRKEETRVEAPRQSASSSYTREWQAASRGLSHKAMYALERVREECALAGPTHEAAFFQYRFAWRKRAMNWPDLLAECAGVCKAMRLEGTKMEIPGAFIYQSLQEAIRLKTGQNS